MHYCNLSGHTKSDLQVTILKRVYKHDPQYIKERESLLIRKFNTFYNGLNKKSKLAGHGSTVCTNCKPFFLIKNYCN